MKHILLIIGFLISITSFGQDTKTIDFITDAKQIDFSDLWTLDSILIENESLIERKQPLGFIGENFQRINIRFISVIQNPNNRLEYFVYGKTRVKDNICDFQGTIKITDSRIYKESDLPPLKQGYLSGDYKFYEYKSLSVRPLWHTGHKFQPACRGLSPPRKKIPVPVALFQKNICIFGIFNELRERVCSCSCRAHTHTHTL